MKKLIEEKRPQQTGLREKIIGLGERSFRKSYYPVLQNKVAELEQFKSIIDLSNDAILFIRVPSGELTYVNVAACQLLGFACNEIVGLTFDRIADEAAQKRVRMLFNDRDQACSFLAGLRTRNGAAVPVEINARRVDVQGATYVVAIARDIAERRAMEKELRESEERFRYLVESMNEGMTVIDAAGVFTYVNPEMCRMLDRRADEILGHPIYDFLDEKNREVFDSQFVLRRTGRREPYEIEWRRRNGEKIYTIISPRPVIDDRGRLVESFAVITDITARRRFEEDLKVSEANYRAIFNTANDAILVIDPGTGALLDCNQKMTEMYGYRPDEVRAVTVGMLSEGNPPYTQEAVLAKVRSTVRGRVSLFEWRARTRDGRVFWAEVSLKRVTLNGRERVLAIVRDIDERKQAEQALRESRERFRSLVETSSDMIWEVDRSGAYTYVSPKIRDLLGYEPDEVLGKTPFDLMPDSERRKVGGQFDRITAERKPFTELQNINLHKNGREVVLESSGVPIIDRDGTFRGYRGIDRDITARRRIEEELAVSKQKLIDIIEFLPDATFVIDKDKRVIAWNKAIETMTGMPKDAIIGQGDYAYAIPFYGVRKPIMIDLIGVHAPQIEAQYDYVKREGNTVMVEVYVPSLYGGKGAYVLGLASPLLDPQGKVVGAIESVRDVTERKTAEMRLQRERDQAKRYLDIAGVMIAVLDTQGRITVMNKKGCAIIGYGERDIIGRNWFDTFIPADSREAVLREFTALLSGTRETETYYENEIITRSGERRTLAFHNTVIKDEHGRFAGVLTSGEDITERKRAEQEIQRFTGTLETRVRERTAQLEEMNRELESFSYSVSHDLRAPLRAIDGFSQMIMEDYGTNVPPEALRYIGVVRQNAQKMGRLIEDLLAFSRVGRQDVRRSAIDMTALVREIAEELAAAAPGRKLDIRVKDLPPASGDTAMIKQVFVNLLSNAVKFTRPRETAEIEVGSFTENGRNVYYVRDNGVGFDMAYADRLFNVFQRLHSTADFEGTGIGLAIVSRIIKKHGGRVWAEGAVDKGATFYVSF
jgi:PAS domain S-box-containing protein